MRRINLSAFLAVAFGSLQLYAVVLPQLASYSAGPPILSSETARHLYFALGAQMAPPVGQALLGVPAVLGWLGLRRRSPLLARGLVLSVLPALGLLVLSPAGFTVRFLMFSHPIVLACVGEGLRAIRGDPTRTGTRAWCSAIVLLAVLSTYGVSLVRYFEGTKVDFKRATAQLESEMGTGDRVGLWFDCKTMLYYARTDGRYRIVGAADLVRDPPEWVCIQDAHLAQEADLQALLDARYEERQRRPSVVERTLLVWRRR